MIKYLKFSVLIVAVVSLFAACSDDDTEVTLVGNWVKVSQFDGNARSNAMSFVIGNKGYMCMGYNGKSRLKDMWEYNAEVGSWTQKANFPLASGRSQGVAFAIGSKGYIGTGTSDGETYLNDFYSFDPSTNTWSQIANMIDYSEDTSYVRRIDAIGFNLGNYGFVGTGYSDGYLKDFYRYDPATNSWKKLAGFTGDKRMGASTFTIGDKVYIVGGLNNGYYNYDFWMCQLNGESLVFTKKRDIKNSNSSESYDDNYAIIRAYASAFTVNSKGYLTCGSNGSVLSDTWEYEPTTDLWTKKTYFEGYARYGAISFTFSNKAIVATGRSSDYRFDDCWTFNPDTAVNKND